MSIKNKPNTKEEQDRINAVTRYLKGEEPRKICKNLGRSKSWLYKWIKRYKNSGKNTKKKWSQEESRAPKKVHRS